MTAEGALLGRNVLELTTDNRPLDAGLARAEVRTIESSRRMGVAWEGVGKRVAGVGQHMSSLGNRWSQSVTLPIVGGAALAVKAAADFEGALTQIRTQAGASGREIDHMRGAILKLAPAVGQTPTHLANALYHIESNGLAGAKALDALRKSAELAAIGHSDLEQTTNAVVTVLHNAPKDVKNASDAIGIMNATIGTGNMRLSDYLGALSTPLLQRAKAAGLGLRDVGAAIDVMTRSGVPAQAAATRLNMTLSQMASPTSAAAKAFKSVGLTQFRLADDMRKPDGLVGAVRDLNSHMRRAGLNANQQNQLITKAFGGGRSSGAVLALMQNVNELDGAFHKIGRNSGPKQLSAAMHATRKDVGFQFDQLKATAQKDAIQIGTTLGPELLKVGKEVAGDADRIVHAFMSLPPGARDAIITGGMISAGLGPALKLAGVLTTGVGRLYDVARLTERLVTGKGLTLGKAIESSGHATSAIATMEVDTLIARSMVGEGGAGTGGVAAGAKEPVAEGASLMSRAGRGAALGLGGLGASQLAGGLIGGRTGHAVSSIGSAMSVGAGFGSLAGPEGTLVGALGGALIGSLIASSHGSSGNKLADAIFSHGFGGAAAKDLQKQTASALDELHKYTTGYVARSAGRGGVIRVPVQLDLPKLSGVDQAKAIAAANRAGTLVAKQLQAGWNQYRFQSDPIMFEQLRSKMKHLPPEAQAAAALSAVKFAEGLERHGRLTRGSAARMLNGIERQFPGFERYLGLAAGASIQQFNRVFDFTTTQRNVKRQLHRISQDFPQVQQAMAETTGTVQDKAAAAVKALRQVASKGTSPMRHQAVADLNALRDSTSKDLGAMAGVVVSKTKQMSGAIEQGSENAARIAAINMGDFASHVVAAMRNGTVATGQGMGLIISTLNQALKEMGQKQLSPIQTGMLSLNIGKQQQLDHTAGGGLQKQLAHHAAGGLIPIGRRGIAGRDAIPLNVGGTPIVVGEGETVAVFNRHQLPVADRLMAPIGGLTGLFDRVNTPNYLASGGIVPRYAGGGRVVTASDFGGPSDPSAYMHSTASGKIMDGSLVGYAELSNPPSSLNFSALGHLPMGTVLPVTYGGKTIRIPKVDVGAGGPGLNGHVRAIDLTQPAANQIGFPGMADVIIGNPAGISLGAGGGAGVQMQTIAAPHVAGSGTIAHLVRAAMTKAAAAANAYDQKHQPPSTAGGGGAAAAVGSPGGPTGVGSYMGVQIANWVIESLRYGAAHGSGNPQPTSGYRPGIDPHTATGTSEHQGTRYPHGAVDFGSFTTGLASKMAVVNATRGFKWPLLAPIGFSDDGHASGTGHARGGLVARPGHQPTLRELLAYEGGRFGGGGIVTMADAIKSAHKAKAKAKSHHPSGIAGAPVTTGTLPLPGRWRPRWPHGHLKALQPVPSIPPNVAQGMDRIDRIIGADGSGGQYAALTDRSSSLAQLFALTDPGKIQTAADAIVTPADGSPQYVDQSLIQGRLQQLTQILGVDQQAEDTLSTALDWMGPVRKWIARALEQRRKRRDALRAQIARNLQMIARLRRQIEVERHRKLPKGAARAAAAQERRARIILWTGQIGVLEAQNAAIRGQGIPAVEKEIATLTTNDATLDSDRLQIVGPSGIGGELLSAKVAVAGDVAAIDAISPAAVTGALAAATTAAAGSGSTAVGASDSALIGDLEQQLTTARQELMVSQVQQGVLDKLGDLPPFGGHFHGGGTIGGGTVGAERHVIAQVGETLLPIGHSTGSHTFHLIVQDGAVNADRIKVIANGEAQRVSRTTSRAAAVRRPGAGHTGRF